MVAPANAADGGAPASFDESQFDWVQLKKEFNVLEGETRRERFLRKIKENPVVPVGCFATFMALSFGLHSFRKGDRRMSQLMMRARIAAQGFTVVALIVGVGMSLRNTTATALAAPTTASDATSTAAQAKK